MYLRIRNDGIWSNWSHKNVTVKQGYTFAANNTYEKRTMQESEWLYIQQNNVSISEYSSNEKQINIDIYRDKGLVVYGCPLDVPGNTFKAGSEDPSSDGYFVNNGVRGEYKYLGWGVGGNLYSNHDYIAGVMLDLGAALLVSFHDLPPDVKVAFDIAGENNSIFSGLQSEVDAYLVTQGLSNYNENNMPNPIVMGNLNFGGAYSPYNFGLINHFNKTGASIRMFFKRNDGTYDYRTLQGIFPEEIVKPRQLPKISVSSDFGNTTMSAGQESIELTANVRGRVVDNNNSLSAKDREYFYTRDDNTENYLNFGSLSNGAASIGDLYVDKNNSLSYYDITRSVSIIISASDLNTGDNIISFHLGASAVFGGSNTISDTGTFTFNVTKEAAIPLSLSPDTPHVYGTQRNYTFSGGSGTDQILSSLADGLATRINNTTYLANSGTGTYTIKLTKGIQEQYFTIPLAKANPSISIENANKAYGDPAFTIGHSTNSNGTKSFTSSNPGVATINNNGVVNIAGMGTTIITFSVQGTNNYNPAFATASITVGKADQAPLSLMPLTPHVYNTLRNYTIGGGSGSGAYSTTLITGPATRHNNTTYLSNSGTGSYTIRVTKAGDANYNEKSQDYTIPLAKAAQNAPVIPAVSAVNQTSVVLTSSPGSMIVCNDQTKANGSTFTGLIPGATYSAYAYYPETPNYNRSPNSQPRVFSTTSPPQISSASVVPNPALAGDQLYFMIQTKNYADKIRIEFDGRIVQKDDRGIEYLEVLVNPLIDEKTTILPYILRHTTDETLTKSGTRLGVPYEIRIVAYRGGETEETIIYLEVSGNVLDLIKPGK